MFYYFVHRVDVFFSSSVLGNWGEASHCSSDFWSAVIEPSQFGFHSSQNFKGSVVI